MRSVLLAPAGRPFDRRRLSAAFAAIGGSPQPAAPLRAVLHDTYDGRLHAAGRLLVGQDGELRLLRRPAAHGADAEATWSGAPAEIPVRAEHWPPGPLRDAVAQVAAERAVLPMVSIDARSWRADGLGADGGASASAAIAAIAAWDGRRLPSRAWLVLVAAEPGGADTLRDLLIARGWTEAEEDPIAGIADAAWAPAADAGDGAAPAGPAMAAAIAAHVDRLERCQRGVIADLDSGFLHQYRVELRRLRALVGQLREALPEAVADGLRAAAKRIAARTGPCRDLDVWLAARPILAAAVPARLAPALEPLFAAVAAQRAQAQAELASALAGAEHRADLAQLRASAAAAASGGAGADEAIGGLVRRRIWKAYRRIARRAAGMVAGDDAERLHDLRIACKKLRYLLDFAVGFDQRPELARLRRQLRAAQEALGEANDAAVQAQAVEARCAGDLPAPTLVAAGALVAALEARRAAAAERAMSRIGRLVRPRVRRRCRRLFKDAAD